MFCTFSLQRIISTNVSQEHVFIGEGSSNELRELPVSLFPLLSMIKCPELIVSPSTHFQPMATRRGKEALVEKFKNSCVMDEREAWRPKIFYSSGPRVGLPEPFPAPTHLRRKERSSQNRGALFGSGSPGAGGSVTRDAAGASATSSGPGLMEGGLLPRGPPFRRPNQHPQNLARHDRY